MSDRSAFLSFERAKFKTRLPHGRLYTAGHMWLREVEPNQEQGAGEAAGQGRARVPEASPDGKASETKAVAEQKESLWQVGLTRFALRMLGEPVDLDFEVPLAAEVERGQVIGWMEGFKALTELYSPLSGTFAGGNAQLEEDIGAVHSSTYERGWIFAVRGKPGEDCVSTEKYAAVLEATIDKMLGADGVNEEGKLE